MIELADIETFLVLAEELHFGRTAERMVVTKARVSQRIQALERRVGGPVFERTTRHVALTELGEELVGRLGPAYQEIQGALEDARARATQLEGTLRVGYSTLMQGAALTELIADFRAAYPAVSLVLIEVSGSLPFEALRAGYVDVVLFWQTVTHPDVVIGPPIGDRARAIVVAASHPLAARSSVTSEVLADYVVTDFELDPDPRFQAGVVPTHTSSGRPVPRHRDAPSSLPELIRLVGTGQIVHVTVDIGHSLFGADTVVVPISDMPALPYGPMWLEGHTDPRTQAFAGMVAAVPDQVARPRS